MPCEQMRKREAPARLEYQVGLQYQARPGIWPTLQKEMEFYGRQI